MLTHSLLRLLRQGCFVLGSVILTAQALPLWGQDAPGVEHYRGFTIDASRDPDAADAAAIEAALKTQVDMVYSVGLPKPILDFFQTVPIEIVPPSGVFTFEPGFYSGLEKNVQVSIDLVKIGHKPVLIHEMLHAFHDQAIDGGVRNPAIIALYNQAREKNAFALQSHMMSNNREFFACAGTTCLFGVTAQEPFHREKIEANQPDLIVFFKSLFGPTAGSYMGYVSP